MCEGKHLEGLICEALEEYINNCSPSVSCDKAKALLEVLKGRPDAAPGKSWVDPRVEGVERDTSLRCGHTEQKPAMGQVDIQSLRSRINELEKKNGELREQLEALKGEKARCESDSQIYGKFVQLHTFMQERSPAMRDMLAQYYTMGDLLTFLVQCGRFDTLIHLWEACYKAISQSGQGVDDAGVCLGRLLDLYNRAAGTFPAAKIEPATAEKYDFELHQRVGGAGSRVHALLLPGLRNSAGVCVLKALVTLR